jgi:hypothetical protein
MTPAEKPSAPDKKRLSKFLVKRVMALPIPVDNPAKAVRPNAIKS